MDHPPNTSESFALAALICPLPELLASAPIPKEISALCTGCLSWGLPEYEVLSRAEALFAAANTQKAVEARERYLVLRARDHAVALLNRAGLPEAAVSVRDQPLHRWKSFYELEERLTRYLNPYGRTAYGPSQQQLDLTPLPRRNEIDNARTALRYVRDSIENLSISPRRRETERVMFRGAFYGNAACAAVDLARLELYLADWAASDALYNEARPVTLRSLTDGVPRQLAVRLLETLDAWCAIRR